PPTRVDAARQPLRSRLLAVPSLRKRYLEMVRTIAEKSFAWNKVKPVIDQYRALIEKEVEIDTRKLYSIADFRTSLADKVPAGAAGPGGRGAMLNLHNFFVQRRAYLLNYKEAKK